MKKKIYDKGCDLKLDSIRKYIAEFIGTFFLLFTGTGAIIVNNLSNNALGHMGIAFTFGFIIVIMIYATGHISGAHFNPAVTIAFAVVRRFRTKDILPYILSQLSGAICASALLKLLLGDVGNMGCTTPSMPIGHSQILVSFIVEFVFTFCLMFVIMSVATDSRAEGSFAGLAIGLTVFVGAAVAGPISGGSFNPARSLAPAIISGQFNSIWIYILSPILGAITASLGYDFIGNTSKKVVATNEAL